MNSLIHLTARLHTTHHLPLPGFVQANTDSEWVQLSLAANVSHFLASHASLLSSDANLEFVWKGPEGVEKALKGLAATEEWSKMMFYVCVHPSHPHR
jgi:hypothetical protein